MSSNMQKQAVRVLECEPPWKRPISGTIGRIPAALTMLLLGDPRADFSEGPDKEWTETVLSPANEEEKRLRKNLKLLLKLRYSGKKPQSEKTKRNK